MVSERYSKRKVVESLTGHPQGGHSTLTHTGSQSKKFSGNPRISVQPHCSPKVSPHFMAHVAEWLRRLTRKPKVGTAVGSSPALGSLVAVRNSSPGRPEPCEGNLVAAEGSCGGPMVKHIISSSYHQLFKHGSPFN